MSEFIDSFLQLLTRKNSSYVKDFLNKVSKIYNSPEIKKKKPIWVSMDIQSLYPNINHKEGIDACKTLLYERNNRACPTNCLTKIIQLILESNTMFNGCYFHQIKWTVMGSPMAVSYANIFMSVFESNMLLEYQNKYNQVYWYFFYSDSGWEISERFPSFPTITFLYSYSTLIVNFLDVTVKVEKNVTLSTFFSAKPTASYQYLHTISSHPFHRVKALPKSQFIRIHRICTFTSDYSKHANMFINFFMKRGYKKPALIKIATEISKIDRRTLLEYTHREKSEHTPLVPTWHHQIQNISRVIHFLYSTVAKKFPEFKNIFKEPPIVAYRCPKSIFSYLVKNRYTSKENTPPKEQCKSKTMINRYMNPLTTITNQISKWTWTIKGGKPTDKNVVYAAECIKHKLIYIGQTRDQLNNCFNRHISDISCYPECCELSKHFNSNDCDFEKDLKILILEKVKGREARR